MGPPGAAAAAGAVARPPRARCASRRPFPTAAPARRARARRRKVKADIEEAVSKKEQAGYKVKA